VTNASYRDGHVALAARFCATSPFSARLSAAAHILRGGALRAYAASLLHALKVQRRGGACCRLPSICLCSISVPWRSAATSVNIAIVLAFLYGMRRSWYAAIRYVLAYPWAVPLACETLKPSS